MGSWKTENPLKAGTKPYSYDVCMVATSQETLQKDGGQASCPKQGSLVVLILNSRGFRENPG
jgi:hypothetical protein